MLKKKYWNYFQIAISESDPTDWHEFYDYTLNLFMNVLLRH